jgi:Protein of unknown function (DUF3592)
VGSTDLEFDAPYPVGPECLPPAPRAIAWNSRARRLRAALIAALMLGPNAILLLGWSMGDDLRALESRGRSTIGRVIDKTSHYNRRSKELIIVYSYEVNGRSYRTSTMVSADEYAALAAGKSCDVTYLPDKPDVSYPGNPDFRLQWHNTVTVFFATLAATGLAIGLAFVVFTFRRERLLAREGEAGVGRVTDRGETRRRQRTLYYVYHEFVSPGETTVTDWHYVPQPLWDRLRPGLRITVLYDTANPERHLPLYAFKYAYIRQDDDLAEDVAEGDAEETPS